jgi:hypothetical protein
VLTTPRGPKAFFHFVRGAFNREKMALMFSGLTDTTTNNEMFVKTRQHDS